MNNEQIEKKSEHKHNLSSIESEAQVREYCVNLENNPSWELLEQLAES